MNRRIQLHYATETVNTYGERVEAWASAGTYWGAVEYLFLRSKEAEEAGQPTAVQEIQVTIRKNASVDENWRVYHDSRLYDIEAIAESNDRQLMILGCRQIQAATLSNPETGYPVGALAFTEEFTGLTADRVTVTVYGGNIPDDPARVLVFKNGLFTNNFLISGNKIIFVGFTIVPADVVNVTFFI